MSSLRQITTATTDHDNFITNHASYNKSRQLLQMTTEKCLFWE